jgi:hypothetical protein
MYDFPDLGIFDFNRILMIIIHIRRKNRENLFCLPALAQDLS